MKLSCEKEPKLPKAFYNYALKLQEQNDIDASIESLDQGLQFFPQDENLLYVKLIGLIKLNRNNEAYDLVNRLLIMSPNNANYLNILRNLQSGRQ